MESSLESQIEKVCICVDGISDVIATPLRAD